MSGQGSPGFCKLCDSPHAGAINSMIAAGKPEPQIKKVIQEFAPDFTWSKPTFYAHKGHITHPLVTAKKNAENHPVIVPQTNRGALEMIRDLGMRRAAENPELVSVDHSLKALSILEGAKKPVADILVLLAKVMVQGSSDADVIEGSYEEVE